MAGQNVTVNYVAVPTVALSGSSSSVLEDSPYTLTIGQPVNLDEPVNEYIIHWGDGLENSYTSTAMAAFFNAATQSYEVTHSYSVDPMTEATELVTVDLVCGGTTYAEAGYTSVAVDSIISNAASASPVSSHPTEIALSVGVSNSSPNGSPLTYRWAATAMPLGATVIDFSSSSARSPTVTVDCAGEYEFTVTITDPGTSWSTTSTVDYTVAQTPSSVEVDPVASFPVLTAYPSTLPSSALTQTNDTSGVSVAGNSGAPAADYRRGRFRRGRQLRHFGRHYAARHHYRLGVHRPRRRVWIDLSGYVLEFDPTDSTLELRSTGSTVPLASEPSSTLACISTTRSRSRWKSTVRR